jgi:hypothetical protein
MIGTQIAINRKKHQPFKHKLRYPRAVTVCIAAVCQENGEPRIALCSDTRLDYGDLGSTNMNSKIVSLAWGWCAQLAGEWSGVNYLSDLVRKKVEETSLAPDDVTSIAEKVRERLKVFMRSAFYQKTETYQLLLSGFVRYSPQLIYVSIYENKTEISLSGSFGVIGSGSHVASSILSLRECNESFPVQYALYVAYEAKRCSEKTGYVGRFTTLLVQAPGSPETKDRMVGAVMGQLGLESLSDLYRRFWRVPFTNLLEIPEFPAEFFANPKVR